MKLESNATIQIQKPIKEVFERIVEAILTAVIVWNAYNWPGE